MPRIERFAVGPIDCQIVPLWGTSMALPHFASRRGVPPLWAFGPADAALSWCERT